MPKRQCYADHHHIGFIVMATKAQEIIDLVSMTISQFITLLDCCYGNKDYPVIIP